MKTNGNGKLKTIGELNNGQQIEFPVTFDLKAVMMAEVLDEINKKRLVLVFDRLLIDHRFKQRKPSSKGTYVSFTYSVTLTSKNQMDKLYEALKLVEGLKFAL